MPGLPGGTEDGTAPITTDRITAATGEEGVGGGQGPTATTRTGAITMAGTIRTRPTITLPAVGTAVTTTRQVTIGPNVFPGREDVYWGRTGRRFAPFVFLEVPLESFLSPRQGAQAVD